MSSTSTFLLRQSVDGEWPVLAGIYHRSVLGLAPRAYEPEQVRTWASYAALTTFVDLIHGADNAVLDADGRAVGFCGIDVDGRVRSLYLLPEFAGRGLGLTLLRHAMQHARARGLGVFTAEASHLSRGVFLRAGFRQVGLDHVVQRGVLFPRFAMRFGAPPPLTEDD